MNKCVHTVANVNFRMTCRLALNSLYAVPSTVGLHRCTIPRRSISTSCQASQVIPGFRGDQYSRDANDKDYQARRYQYATSSHEDEGHMTPSLILYPKDSDDVKSVVEYARSEKIAIATRTGGHQYSGASSTYGNNIQLDLSKTFAGDINYYEKDGKHFVRTSVSWELLEINEFLGERGLFVPHGQCSHVHIGGHVQTGGYGQLGRSFGLFGDHVVSLEIIDSGGNKVTVTKDSNKDLFYAILGGSPGNFGVLTHFTIKVYSNNDYKGSRGLKTIYWYSPDTLKNLLNILVEMANDENFPRNYDYCVSMLSSSFDLFKLCPELDGQMRISHPDLYGKDGTFLPDWPSVIVVYAQYVPLAEGDKYNPDWFDKIKRSGDLVLGSLPIYDVTKKNMSELTKDWIFENVREFKYPYIKRTYLTKSKTLIQDGWVDWVTGRVDEIASSINGCRLSVQIQNFGGNNSMFYRNRDNGTSYSWRDSTIVCVLDCFYNQLSPFAKEIAEKWQFTNDNEGIGSNGKFSKEDRRVLWGSYSRVGKSDEFNMGCSWPYYHDNKKQYDRLCKIKEAVDPDNVFTPNDFCVGVQCHQDTQ